MTDTNKPVANFWVSVHGPGLVGYGAFGGPPSFAVDDLDADVKEVDGNLTITVKPHITRRGVEVSKTVTFPKGSWTHIVKAAAKEPTS